MFARINWLLLYLLLIKPLSCLRRVPGHALLSVLGSARHALILCTVALINNEIGFSWPDSDWQLLGQELHWWHFSQKCVGLAVLHSYLHQINKKTIIPNSKLSSSGPGPGPRSGPGQVQVRSQVRSKRSKD